MLKQKLSTIIASRVLPLSVRRKKALIEIKALRENAFFKSQRADDFVKRKNRLREIDVIRDALHSARHGVKRIPGKAFNYAFLDEMMKANKNKYESELNAQNNASKDRMDSKKSRLKISKKWRLKKSYPANIDYY